MTSRLCSVAHFLFLFETTVSRNYPTHAVVVRSYQHRLLRRCKTFDISNKLEYLNARKSCDIIDPVSLVSGADYC